MFCAVGSQDDARVDMCDVRTGMAMGSLLWPGAGGINSVVVLDDIQGVPRRPAWRRGWPHVAAAGCVPSVGLPDNVAVVAAGSVLGGVRVWSVVREAVASCVGTAVDTHVTTDAAAFPGSVSHVVAVGPVVVAGDDRGAFVNGVLASAVLRCFRCRFLRSPSRCDPCLLRGVGLQ